MAREFGKGKIIFATTPHVAANAYQDFPANYEFLAQLVSDNEQSLWVDEYIHGYRDVEAIKEGSKQNIVIYLAKTPLFPAFIQILVILIIAVLAGLLPLGEALTLTTSPINNSEAYIKALAGVLQKADSTDFVFEVISKEEKLQLQKALGLGEFPVDNQLLIEAWVKQTGGSQIELKTLLQEQSRIGTGTRSKKHSLSESDY